MLEVLFLLVSVSAFDSCEQVARGDCGAVNGVFPLTAFHFTSSPVPTYCDLSTGFTQVYPSGTTAATCADLSPQFEVLQSGFCVNQNREASCASFTIDTEFAFTEVELLEPEIHARGTIDGFAVGQFDSSFLVDGVLVTANDGDVVWAFATTNSAPESDQEFCPCDSRFVNNTRTRSRLEQFQGRWWCDPSSSRSSGAFSRMFAPGAMICTASGLISAPPTLRISLQKPTKALRVSVCRDQDRSNEEVALQGITINVRETENFARSCAPQQTPQQTPPSSTTTSVPTTTIATTTTEVATSVTTAVTAETLAERTLASEVETGVVVGSVLGSAGLLLCVAGMAFVLFRRKQASRGDAVVDSTREQPLAEPTYVQIPIPVVPSREYDHDQGRVAQYDSAPSTADVAPISAFT
jgi:hypothetical protein